MVKVAVSILSLILAYLLLPQIVRSLSIEKYEWLPTESAHHEFPMTVIGGNLDLKDGTSIYVPATDITKNGWGELGSTHVVGRDEKALPVKLTISWFSYVEDKFFRGSFDLPYEQLSSLFAKGRISAITGKKITFQRVMVGLAPAGEVSVWLLADGEVLHGASFTAEEYDGDWSQVTESERYSRAEYIKMILQYCLSKDQYERLQKDAIPYKEIQWYRKMYKWSFKGIGPRKMFVWIRSYNGEHEYFDLNHEKQDRTHRAAPKELEITWQGQFGKWYRGEVFLNESEVLKAFEKLSMGDVNHDMQLLVEVAENNHVELSLKNSKFILGLKQVLVKVHLLPGPPLAKGNR